MTPKPTPRRASTRYRVYTSQAVLLASLLLSNCVTPTPQLDEPLDSIATPPAQSEPIRPAPAGPAARFPTETVAQVTVITPPGESRQESTQDPAKALVDSGRYLDAALLLSDLAFTLPSPSRQDYLLRVTTLLLQGNYVQQADQILQQIDVQNLPLDYSIKKSILSAELNLAKQNPEGALQILQSLSRNINQSSSENLKAYYLALIDVYGIMGVYTGSAQARNSLAGLLDDNEELLENQEILLRDLQNLNDAELMKLSQQTPDLTFRGWVELARLAAAVRDDQQAQAQVDRWQQQFPNHPVNASIINTIVMRQSQTLGRPSQIAVILPMSGRHEKPATAIRDGLLAAYYAEPNQQAAPRLRFYDEGDDPNRITDIYQQAVNDGANFIVGPLSKEAVTTLASKGNTSISLLTLNYSDSAIVSYVPPNFFQMSLSPEQEAVHVAEHAWLDGHTNAAAIYPQTPWGERLYQAFKTRWEELGGVIVEPQTYNSQDSDYGVPIKKLLNLDESEMRFAAVRNLLGGKIQYEPRRRMDVDFVFMAASARQGRLLKPQLKFHHASDVPVYATSHVYTGQSKPELDRDMNDVRFSDMPWTLKEKSDNAPLKAQIEKLFPGDSLQLMRMYALGIDAFQILPELNRMRRNRFATYQGETGVLFLDANNRLQRKLLWAQFVQGKPKILAEF